MSKHTPGPWTLTQTKHETIVDSWHIHIGEHQIPVFPYKRIYSDDCVATHRAIVRAAAEIGKQQEKNNGN
jgi:hypothetical protein